MRERALLLVLLGACLLSLLVAYWQYEVAEETRTRYASKTSELHAAVEKNVELSEQITDLTDESARLRAAAREAGEAKEKSDTTIAGLEAALETKENEAKALQKNVAALEAKGNELKALQKNVTALEAAVKALSARLEEERETTQTRFGEILKKLSDFESQSGKILEDLDKRMTPLPGLVGEVASLVRETTSRDETEANVRDELTRLVGLLDEQKTSLQSLNRKIEILGKMLAAEGRPFSAQAAPPPPIEATVAAVDASRNEIALSGDLGADLRPGHEVWVSRDGTVVGRAEVFRVDPTTRLAAARISWLAPGKALKVGDRVTTDRPGEETPDAEGAPPDAGASSPEGEGEKGARRSEGPETSLEEPASGRLTPRRPPPPPPRPERDG